MIKTYGYTDNTQLSPHFNAQEFRCKCGREHDFQIDDDLITKLTTFIADYNQTAKPFKWIYAADPLKAA